MTVTSLEANNWEILFTKLYKSAEFSDITFARGDDKFHGHNLVLMMRAPEFHRKTVQSKCNVEIAIPENVSTPVFQEFWKFIYTGDCTVVVSNVMDLSKLAREYKMEALEQKCLHWMELQLTVENCSTVLQTVVAANETIMIEFVINFIRKHFVDVLKTDTFLKIDKQSLEKILQINGIESGSEVDVFSAVVKWTRHATLGSAFNGTKMREHLGSLLFLIRFPTMTNDEFTLCVSQNEALLRHDEIGAIYLEINAHQKNQYGFGSRLRSEKYVVGGVSVTPEINQLIVNDHPHYDWVNELPSTTTRFTVSKAVTLIGVHVTGADEEINATVRLLNAQDQCVTHGQIKITKNNFHRVDFEDAVVLAPNRIYKIAIQYEFAGNNVKYWCYRQKVEPWSVSQCDVEFVFSKLSRMIYKIYFN